MAPAPTTLRIKDSRQGKAEAPIVRSRTFQLTVEEARPTPDVVKGMYILPISLFMLLFLLIFICFIFRIIPCERSFVFLALSKWFFDAPRELDCPLEVEIADDRTVRVLRVH